MVSVFPCIMWEVCPTLQTVETMDESMDENVQELEWTLFFIATHPVHHSS